MKESNRLNNLISVLNAGLNIKPVTDTVYDTLRNCSQKDWEQLSDCAMAQGVGGIFFDGIQSIYHTHGNPLPDTEWGKKIKSKLLSIAIQLEQRNRRQLAVMCKMGEYLKKHGCRMMVMKGQACAMWYPNPAHRSVGDIDFYLLGDYAKGNEAIRKLGVHVDDSWYKHSEFSIEGEAFENHQYFVATRGGKHYKELNELLCKLAKDSSMEHYPNSDVLLPPLMFNALFLTCHAYAHFMSEGLRLKQVLDWVALLQQHQQDIDWDELHRICDRMKLNRFLEVMNTIAVKNFGVAKCVDAMRCDSPYVNKVMDSILYDDSYIFNTGEGKWKQRLHIVSNMVKYRWKYRDIAQQSVINQLWTNLMGFVFKTE